MYNAAMRWKIAAVLFVVACLLLNLFPTFGRPQFRYTGSDPSKHVWNLGWPSATAIYDHQSGLHVGPMAYVLVPVQCVVLVVSVVAIRLVRGKLRVRSSNPMGSICL